MMLYVLVNDLLAETDIPRSLYTTRLLQPKYQKSTKVESSLDKRDDVTFLFDLFVTESGKVETLTSFSFGDNRLQTL